MFDSINFICMHYFGSAKYEELVSMYQMWVEVMCYSTIQLHFFHMNLMIENLHILIYLWTWICFDAWIGSLVQINPANCSVHEFGSLFVIPVTTWITVETGCEIWQVFPLLSWTVGLIHQSLKRKTDYLFDGVRSVTIYNSCE